MLFLLLASLPSIDESKLQGFATKEATRHVSEILKSPSTAKFEAVEVYRPAPSTFLRQGRYCVKGHVDSQNGFGATVRSGWVVTVALDEKEEPELLAVSYFEGRGDKLTSVYLAHASKRYRSDVYDRVRADYKVSVDKFREQAKRYPTSKRAMFLERNAKQFVEASRKKFGLDQSQILDILEIQPRLK